MRVTLARCRRRAIVGLGLCLATALPGVVRGQAPTPNALGGFGAHRSPFPFATDPACNANYAGASFFQAISCSPFGMGSASGALIADVGTGRISARALTVTGGNETFGGLELAAGHWVQFAAGGRLEYTLGLTPHAVTHTPTHFMVHVSFDGTMRTNFGNWDGPSAFGITHASDAKVQFIGGPVGVPAARTVGDITFRYDGFTEAGGAVLVNHGAYSNGLTPLDGWADIERGVLNSQWMVWDPSAETRFSVALSLRSLFVNMTAHDLRYRGAVDDLDFFNTTYVRSVQVFDAAGNDISRFVDASLNGQPIATGVFSAVPEPATLALVSGGLLGLGAVARRKHAV